MQKPYWVQFFIARVDRRSLDFIRRGFNYNVAKKLAPYIYIMYAWIKRCGLSIRSLFLYMRVREAKGRRCREDGVWSNRQDATLFWLRTLGVEQSRWDEEMWRKTALTNVHLVAVLPLTVIFTLPRTYVLFDDYFCANMWFVESLYADT